MRTLLPTLLICVVALAVAALAQEKPPTTPAVASLDNPFSAWNKRTYGSGAAKLAAIPVGESPTDRRSSDCRSDIQQRERRLTR